MSVENMPELSLSVLNPPGLRGWLLPAAPFPPLPPHRQFSLPNAIKTHGGGGHPGPSLQLSDSPGGAVRMCLLVCEQPGDGGVRQGGAGISRQPRAGCRAPSRTLCPQGPARTRGAEQYAKPRDLGAWEACVLVFSVGSRRGGGSPRPLPGCRGAVLPAWPCQGWFYAF